MIQSKRINGIDVAYVIADPLVDDINAAFKLGATVKELGQAAGVSVAANLNYANNTTGTPIGRTIVDGIEVISDGPKTLLRDELYMMHDKSLHIGKAPKQALWALQGSPPLLRDGKDVIDEGLKRDQLDKSAWQGEHVQIAYGITSAGWLVVARTDGKVTLQELQGIMRSLGCIHAIKGDGGGSAYLWPHDNGWGRKMGAALVIKKGEVEPMGKLTVKEWLIPKGRKNRPGHSMKAEWITIHLTGNKARTADAENHAKYLAENPTSAAAPVSWHFTADDKLAYQHLPTNESGWHAGDGSSGTGNRKSIGVEVCENEGSNQAQAWLNAAQLTAQLMFEENLPISAVVQHNKWSGKNCPQDLRANNGAGWKKFIEDVKKARAALDPLPKEEKPVVIVDGFTDIAGHWAQATIQKAISAGAMNGFPDGTWRPDEPLTRAQAVVLLDRLNLL